MNGENQRTGNAVFRKRSTNRSLPPQEEILADYARRLRQHRAGRRAAHVHISRLSRVSHHPQDLRVAAETFNTLKRQHEGQVFRLANHDIVFIGRNLSLSALDDVILKLRFMFRDDPCFAAFEQNAGEDPFCTYYDIERDYDAFAAMAQAMLAATRQAAQETDSSVIPFAPAAARVENKSAKGRASLLATGGHTRCEHVYALDKSGRSAPILSEIHFIPAALRKAAAPPRKGETSDCWLMRTLAEGLEPEGIGALLDDGPVPAAITLPLDAASVLTPEFDALVTAFRHMTRGAMVFELAASGLIIDPDLFLKARTRILNAGHKITLTGWNPIALSLFNSERLDIHFHKIAWRHDIDASFPVGWESALATTIRAIGMTKTILTGCLSAEAIRFGQRHGILLYQGSYPESVANTA